MQFVNSLSNKFLQSIAPTFFEKTALAALKTDISRFKVSDLTQFLWSFGVAHKCFQNHALGLQNKNSSNLSFGLARTNSSTPSGFVQPKLQSAQLSINFIRVVPLYLQSQAVFLDAVNRSQPNVINTALNLYLEAHQMFSVDLNNPSNPIFQNLVSNGLIDFGGGILGSLGLQASILGDGNFLRSMYGWLCRQARGKGVVGTVIKLDTFDGIYYLYYF